MSQTVWHRIIDGLYLPWLGVISTLFKSDIVVANLFISFAGLQQRKMFLPPTVFSPKQLGSQQRHFVRGKLTAGRRGSSELPSES